MKILKKLFKAEFSSRDTKNHQYSSSSRLIFLDTGFHGDQYLIQLVDRLISNCNCFVETGANVGSTVAYVARKYPHVECLSCEPDPQVFEEATRNTRNLSNVRIYNETSQDFLVHVGDELESLDKGVFFWLDAHGYGFDWPLREELSFVTMNLQRAYILIDDFKVPGLDCFGFDEYGGQVCSFEYIEDTLNPDLEYRLCYPNYTDRTSAHHPLRGWALIEFGHRDEFTLSDPLARKIQCSKYSRETA